MNYPHKPVLMDGVLEAFSGVNLKRFIDGTLGAGGHAEAILKSHPEIEEYVGIDQDLSALDIAKKRLAPFEGKMRFVHGNFSEALEGTVDGILLDLGVSSMQLDQGERGFSFREDGPLDMRMDQTKGITAEEIVNTYSQEDLGRIFRDYGEEKQWRKAAKAIVEARKLQPIKTTLQLAKLLEPVLFSRKFSIHPATLVFQALRIAVNNELGVVEKALPKAIEMLRPGGRLAVISFHSLEDRIVKEMFRNESLDKESTSGLGGGLFLDKVPVVNLITRKPIMASEEEAGINPRARSAKLRVCEKI